MSKVSTKPYLIRAIYEWCVDQGFTPHLAVVVDERTRVPPGYARDGQIVLNLGPDATAHLVMGNELITFQARFGGAAHALSIPISNVLAVYARENGHGMAFEPETGVAADEAAAADEDSPERGDADLRSEPDDDQPPPRGGHLKIVK
jgi:stringent starvation protein B